MSQRMSASLKQLARGAKATMRPINPGLIPGDLAPCLTTSIDERATSSLFENAAAG